MCLLISCLVFLAVPSPVSCLRWELCGLSLLWGGWKKESSGDQRDRQLKFGLGKGRVRILEDFEKWEWSTVLRGLWPLYKAHQRGMGKVRDDRLLGKFPPGQEWASLAAGPARLGGCSVCGGHVERCISVLCCECPEQLHQNASRLWLFMQHNRKSQSGGFLNNYFRVDGQQDNSDADGNDFIWNCPL